MDKLVQYYSNIAGRIKKLKINKYPLKMERFSPRDGCLRKVHTLKVNYESILYAIIINARLSSFWPRLEALQIRFDLNKAPSSSYEQHVPIWHCQKPNDEISMRSSSPF